MFDDAWNVVDTIGNEEAVRMSSAHSFFTEIVEIRILRKVEKPTDNNADQGDRFIGADEAREWQTQQDENKARIRR